MSETISAWLNKLDSPEKQTRKEAIRALSYMGEAAVGPLLEHLGQEDVDLTVMADILGQIGQPALERLADVLQTGDVLLKRHSAQVLGMIADSRSVLPLVIATDDPDPSVRAMVVHALGNYSDPRAIAPLIDKLEDEHAQVRANAAAALGSYYRDPRVEQAVLKISHDSEAIVRVGAARAMAQLRDERVLNRLQQLSSDADEDVRLTAAASLQHLGGDRMVFERMKKDDIDEQIQDMMDTMLQDGSIDEEDMDLLRNSNPRVRARLLQLVRDRGGANAVKLLLPGLNDINPAVRKAAVDALIDVGEAAVPALRDALQNPSQFIRMGAVEAYSEIGPDDAVTVLAPLLKDPSPQVRLQVVDALAAVSQRDGALRALKNALKDTDRSVRERAEEQLEKLGYQAGNPVQRFFRRITGRD